MPPMGDELVTKSARVVPMLSSEWQVVQHLEDRDKPEGDAMFRWDGNFVANEKLLGHWTLLTEVAEIGEFDPTAKPVRARNPVVSSLTFRNGGVTDDPTRAWSGDRLMDLDKYQALQMEVRTVGGADYLFVEAGGFSTRNKPEWKSKWLVLARR